MGTRKLVRRSLVFVAPDIRAIILMLGLALTVSILGVVEPLVTKYIFDQIGLAGPPRVIVLAVAGLLALEVGRASLGSFMSVLMWDVRVRTDYRLRERLVEKLCMLPISYHREQRVGGLINRMNQGVTGFLNAFIEISANMLPAAVFLVLSVVAMFRLDWHLSFAVMVFVPVPTLIGAWAAREQAHRERVLLEKWSEVYARLNETLSGMLTVKGFARERTELDQFLAQSAEGNAIVQAGIRRDTATTAARNFAATLARVAAIGYGGYLVLAGVITIGTLVAFLGYIGALFGPVQGLTGAYQTLRRGLVGLEAVFAILDTEEEVKDLPSAREAGPLTGAVSFRQVGFAYDRRGNAVLSGIDLEIRPGEMVALVGPSGSGKTSLVSLLQRQYEVTSGAILVDGVDIRDLSLHSLRRQVGVVFQDVHLFNDSIRANIAYGRPDATRKEIEDAARAACAHDFIMTLPDGYETVVGERGSRLSGGQKQRIAIARALLVDPPILILDEATSALDAESEAQVQEGLQNLTRGRTTVVIAHRLSTVVNADRIVVLRNGRIEAIGSHEDLMSAEGYYAYLVRLQSNGMLYDPSSLVMAA